MDADYLDAFRTVLDADYSWEGLAQNYGELDDSLTMLEDKAPNRPLKEYFHELHQEVTALYDGYRQVTGDYASKQRELDRRCQPGNVHRGVQIATPLGMATYGFITGLAGGPLVATLSGALGLVAGYIAQYAGYTAAFGIAGGTTLACLLLLGILQRHAYLAGKRPELAV